MSQPAHTSESVRKGQLFVAVIGIDGQGRIAATTALAQCENVQTHVLTNYPRLDDVPHLLKQRFDAFLIDLDGSPEDALELVEKLCTGRSPIVMVFSARTDPQLMLRSMRAGAREFFTSPFSQEALTRALLWIAARSQAVPSTITAAGRMLVFFGSKGGAGVTTLAVNFAVALAAECSQSTVLIEFDLSLGDAAKSLGMDAPYSLIDALEYPIQLDSRFFSKHLVRHSSGLFVLAAPSTLTSDRASDVEFGCLLEAARELFSYVVVDAGKKIDINQLHLFDESTTAYLVTQIGIPELRNANRLISLFSADRSPKLEIVINRHRSRSSGITEEHLEKALARPIRWRVLNDFEAVSEMHLSGTPIVDRDLPIGHDIRQMARSACGLPDPSRGAIGRGFFRTSWRRLTPEKSKAKPEPSKLSPVRS